MKPYQLLTSILCNKSIYAGSEEGRYPLGFAGRGITFVLVMRDGIQEEIMNGFRKIYERDLGKNEEINKWDSVFSL
jgi:hypothetical protein